MSNLEDRSAARNNNGRIQVPTITPGVDPENDPGAIPKDDFFWKGAHAAKLVCIAAAFVIPNLLVLRVLL